MLGNKYFQVLRGLDDMTSKIIDTAMFLGTGVDISGADVTKAIAAYGTGFEGFLAQQVTTAGPTELQKVTGIKDLPAQVGQAVSIIRGEGLIEVEGLPNSGVDAAVEPNLLITAGTGELTAATAEYTELSFRNGKWRVAQTGDRVCGEMKRAALTPEDTGNIRCLIRVFRGGIKA